MVSLLYLSCVCRNSKTLDYHDTKFQQNLVPINTLFKEAYRRYLLDTFSFNAEARIRLFDFLPSSCRTQAEPRSTRLLYLAHIHHISREIWRLHISANSCSPFIPLLNHQTHCDLPTTLFLKMKLSTTLLALSSCFHSFHISTINAYPTLVLRSSERRQ